MLFNPLVVGASLLLPALAVAGFVWTRRLRYAPFFLFVFLVGVAIEVAGVPDGTPSRDAMEWIYRNVAAAALHAHDSEGRSARGDRRGWASWAGGSARVDAPGCAAAGPSCAVLRWWPSRVALGC